MARIFINYRRDDAPGVAGRLFDHLALKYSRRELFMDVDAMQPGIDFAKQLDAQVAQCHVLLAVIGPHWLDAHDQAGKRRLDSDKDYVRLELASALKRDIAVIPVLVDGAALPPEDSLSDDLKSLARRHALELRHTRFNADADAIMRALEAVVPRRRVTLMLGAASVAVAALAAVAAIVLLRPKLPAKPPQPPAAVATAQPAPANPPAAPALPPVQPAAPAQSAAPTQPAAPAQPTAPTQQSAAPVPAASAPAFGLPAGVKLGEMLNGVALRGSLFRATDIPADPVNCQAACRTEARCVAWTYTQPAAQGLSARCSLKAVIPALSQDICCTSGIEREPPPEMREPPPVSAAVTGALRGIELEGGTYRYFEGTDATPEACQAACRTDGQCLAWDYVRPGVYSADARCFLKNRSSMQVASPCCIAGFERQAAVGPAPPPAPVSPSAALAPGGGPLVNVNLLGSDYRGVPLASDNATLCQSACKADNKCLAWTYVRPGVQGPNAHCWLKNTVPRPTASPCCISGVERTEAK